MNGTAAATRAPIPEAKEPEKSPDIEAMCARVSELRELAVRLEVRAKEIAFRLLGPTPAEESPAIATPNVPCLTGVIAADTRETREALHGLGYSLDRIYQELGKVGQE